MSQSTKIPFQFIPDKPSRENSPQPPTILTPENRERIKQLREVADRIGAVKETLTNAADAMVAALMGVYAYNHEPTPEREKGLIKDLTILDIVTEEMFLAMVKCGYGVADRLEAIDHNLATQARQDTSRQLQGLGIEPDSPDPE